MYFCIILTLFQEVSSLHSKRFAGNSARTVCMVRRTNWWQFPNNICGSKSLNAGSLQIEAMYVRAPLRALSLARSPRRNRLNLPVFNTVPTKPVKWNATEASSMLMIKGTLTLWANAPFTQRKYANASQTCQKHGSHFGSQKLTPKTGVANIGSVYSKEANSPSAF